MAVPSILTKKSGEKAHVGGNIMSSILDRLSLKKCCDIQADMSVN